MQNDDASIVVIGNGKLAEQTAKELRMEYPVLHLPDVSCEIPEEATLILVVYDDWHPDLYKQAEMVLKQGNQVWLSGYVTWMEGVVGPLIRPREPGCSQCAQLRRTSAGSDREEILKSQLSLLFHGKIIRDDPVPIPGFTHMAHLLAEESRKFMQGKPMHTEDHLYLVDVSTLECSLHPIVPDPLCQVCGCLPDDSPLLAELKLQRSPKISPQHYRSTSPDKLRKLLSTYYDEKTGIMNKKVMGFSTTFADVAFYLPSHYGEEVVGGKSHVFAVSETIAALEGLERLCGMSPRGRQVTVFDSYRNLREQALDPVTVGVYSKAQYESPDFPYEPFDPDRIIPWVWGYSLLQERPLLVPEQLAYYSDQTGFVHEFSNGCALGGNLVEAIFHGILEVVERDSFLMTWYAQLPLTRIDPHSVEDASLRLMVERLQAITGYDILLFNSTMEHGIPSIWAVAKNRNPNGANLLCAAGAHLDPLRAAKGAILEIASSIPRIEEAFKENQASLLAMFDDPLRVEQMEDHAFLYSLPQAGSRLAFLLEQSSPPRSFDEQFPRPSCHEDLRTDLQDLLDRLQCQGLEVVVIDQTTPEISSKNLHCVKVLIPGMLPMSFGYLRTRLTGLDRVFCVPQKLGFKKKRMNPEQWNPYPHPFL